MGNLDYVIDRHVNEVVRAHHLLSVVTAGFAEYGVIVFGAMAVLLWLPGRPGRNDVWKRACAAALSAATIGLLVNQAIGHLWHRPRPYQAHHDIIPVLARSTDPSFPSDHATAAFAIAFGVFFVHRRAGYVFLLFAAVIAASRVMAGMHYPTDVVGGVVIGLGCGYFTAAVAMRPVLEPMIGLLSRFTDPVLGAVRRSGIAGHLILNPHRRSVGVGAVGFVLLTVFAVNLREHLLDEMDMTVLLLWAGVVALAMRIAAARFDPPATR